MIASPDTETVPCVGCVPMATASVAPPLRLSAIGFAEEFAVTVAVTASAIGAGFGVTELDALEAGPGPMLFVAVTLNV
ncbi:hypothetical protein [Ensifer sp. ENS02]|uniref:hypothetical protein n=1 Tax=Ensifer sp. ENS02 TaxID=2769290 RepID=UPI001FF07550|nr:hypothetical protein [Ensifer sp. ENS02]